MINAQKQARLDALVALKEIREKALGLVSLICLGEMERKRLHNIVGEADDIFNYLMPDVEPPKENPDLPRFGPVRGRY